MNIVDIITQVGFPIACCIVLGIFVNKMYQHNLKREEKLYIELDESRKINEKAIDTLAVYAAKLENIENGIGDIKEDIKNIVEILK